MKKDRDIRLYLDDILEAIGKIEKYTEGLDFEKFRTDDKTGDAVIRNFLVIGEAVKKIPPDIRKKNSHTGRFWQVNILSDDYRMIKKSQRCEGYQ